MKTRHQIPEAEVDAHCRDRHCPCDPIQHVSARPGEQPVVTITHQPFPTEEPS